jgi:hypothetical protein
MHSLFDTMFDHEILVADLFPLEERCTVETFGIAGVSLLALAYILSWRCPKGGWHNRQKVAANFLGTEILQCTKCDKEWSRDGR